MSLFQNEREAVQKIMKVLNKSYISSDSYRSTQEPFMCKNKEKRFDIEFKENNLFEKIPDGLNRNIILIYKIFGNPKKEIYLSNWTIMSLEEALKQYEEYCKNGQENIFNIGYRYLGMGHIEVISCDLNSHLLFYRPDGGSNGYDRLANHNEIIKNGSKKYKQFFFSDWFYKIEFDN